MVGFASVRLRGQRDRALTRADSIANALAQRSAELKVISDKEVERTADAYLETARLDPIGRLTVILTWVVAGLMATLGLLYCATSGSDLTLLPSEWTFDTWAGLFVLTVAVGVATVGTIEYSWIRDDLAQRLDNSPIGAVRRAMLARHAKDTRGALVIMNALLAEFESWPWAFAFRAQLHAEQDQLAAAVVDLDRALALDPTSVWYRVSRAELLMRQSKAGEALADLEQLGPRLPNDREVVRLQGWDAGYFPTWPAVDRRPGGALHRHGRGCRASSDRPEADRGGSWHRPDGRPRHG